MPAIGIVHEPWDANTSSVPTNGAVQVTEVSVKVAPIRSAPSELPGVVWRAARSAELATCHGIPISNQPNRLAANSTNSAASTRFTHGSEARRLRPDAPKIAA